jgi:hypothetical protein
MPSAAFIGSCLYKLFSGAFALPLEQAPPAPRPVITITLVGRRGGRMKTFSEPGDAAIRCPHWK